MPGRAVPAYSGGCRMASGFRWYRRQNLIPLLSNRYRPHNPKVGNIRGHPFFGQAVILLPGFSAGWWQSVPVLAFAPVCFFNESTKAVMNSFAAAGCFQFDSCSMLGTSSLGSWELSSFA